MLRLPDPNSQSASDRLKPLENANPRLHVKTDKRPFSPSDADDNVADDFDEREIFDLIRNINDPEHPLTLEQLDVVKIEDVKVTWTFVTSLRNQNYTTKNNDLDQGRAIIFVRAPH